MYTGITATHPTRGLILCLSGGRGQERHAEDRSSRVGEKAGDEDRHRPQASAHRRAGDGLRRRTFPGKRRGEWARARATGGRAGGRFRCSSICSSRIPWIEDVKNKTAVPLPQTHGARVRSTACRSRMLMYLGYIEDVQNNRSPHAHMERETEREIKMYRVVITAIVGGGGGGSHA